MSLFSKFFVVFFVVFMGSAFAKKGTTVKDTAVEIKEVTPATATEVITKTGTTWVQNDSILIITQIGSEQVILNLRIICVADTVSITAANEELRSEGYTSMEKTCVKKMISVTATVGSDSAKTTKSFAKKTYRPLQ